MYLAIVANRVAFVHVYIYAVVAQSAVNVSDNTKVLPNSVIQLLQMQQQYKIFSYDAM